MRMRKKKHGFDRFTALSSLIIQDSAALIESPSAPFLNKNPLRLEIGCGKGDFIAETARLEDGYNYFALEKNTDVVIAAAEKYAEVHGLGATDAGGRFSLRGEYKVDDGYRIPAENCGNVRFIRADAKDIQNYFPPDTFSCIYLNFSDPWQGRRRAKRRLTHPDFMKIYLRLLTAGGELRIKTDNTELFEFTLNQIKDDSSDFKLAWETNDLHASDHAHSNVITEYERFFTERGEKINALIAVKK